MNEKNVGLLESFKSHIKSVYRSRVLKISQETSNSFSRAGSGNADEALKESEPLAELRARTDGKNIALSYIIPSDRYTSFVLSLSNAAKDSTIAEKLAKNFDYPNNEFLMQVTRNEAGNLAIFVSVNGLVLENLKDGSLTKLEKDQFYEITDEIQNNGRIILNGKDGARLALRIHDNKPHNLTEREKYLIANEPQIRRIHNEAWLNSGHIPTAYVEDDYDEAIDGSPLEFLKNNEKGEGSEKWKWRPFCPDRDKYWGIAARNPRESCETLENMDVCIVVSDRPGIQHTIMPLDMPRTYLANETIIYLKPEIEHDAKTVGTEGQTGLIHLGNDPHEGWFYVTQPIPKLSNGKVEGYFVLIGRKATLIPEKEETLFDSFWNKSSST